jgi:hypothetical protein
MLGHKKTPGGKRALDRTLSQLLGRCGGDRTTRGRNRQLDFGKKGRKVS